MISTSIMVANQSQGGFTVVEVIVTIVVLSIFMTVFFQSFITAESQRVAVTRNAAANDIAQSNLRKITDHSSLLPPCDTVVPNNNDLTSNPNAPGSVLGITPESLSNTPLPPSASQSVLAFYPNGCSSKIILVKSIVTFGTESVVHATYVLQ